MEKELHYFKTPQEWRLWLHENHDQSKGVDLVFYRVDSAFESMRWEEAVQVAICYGWIDSTVRRIDDDAESKPLRREKTKSVWSKLNKTYIEQHTKDGLMHASGLRKIETAKQNGSWESLDHVENHTMPKDLEAAFKKNKKARENFHNFSPSYCKSYLYWLNQAKREETRAVRIQTIVELCEKHIKARQ